MDRRIARRDYDSGPPQIYPAGGGSSPPAQLLNFVGQVTGRIHQDQCMFPPGYDPQDAGTKYPIFVFAHGKQSSASNAVTATRTRLLANMGSGNFIRNCIALYPEAGDHSWYCDDLAADANIYDPNGDPYRTMIRSELLPYFTQRVRWNGQLIVMTFSMGCQWLKWVPDDLITWGLRGINFYAGPRLQYDFGGAWTASGGPPTDDVVFQEVFGQDPATPQTNSKYIASSPKTAFVNNLAQILAATAGTLGIRAGCGASDGTLTGHDAFLNTVLVGNSVPFTKPTPNGGTVDTNGNFTGVGHSWPGCIDADTGGGPWSFLEARLAA